MVDVGLFGFLLGGCVFLGRDGGVGGGVGGGVVVVIVEEFDNLLEKVIGYEV